MKFLFIVSCFTFAAVVAAHDSMKLTDEHKAKAKSFVEDCLQQEKLAPEAIQGLSKGDFSNRGEHLQCFVNCYLEKTEAFADGQVKENIAIQKFGPIVGEDKLKSIMTKCNGYKGANKCDTAFHLYECFYGEKAAFM